MLATVLSATLHGLEGRVVRVEVDVAPGLPGFTIVGLPDAALSEARERVRGAIRNSGLVFPPRRITVNLAPAELPKSGASLDLAIAVAILLGSEQLSGRGRPAFVGELSLGGELRRMPGLLPMVIALAQRGVRRVVVPNDGAREAGLVANIDVVPARDLGAVVDLLRAHRRPRKLAPSRVDFVPTIEAPYPSDSGDRTNGPPAAATTIGGSQAIASSPGGSQTVALPAGNALGIDIRPYSSSTDLIPDLSEVRGQLEARRALEIALAGGHGLLMVGPPGSGKTLIARTIPGLLPPLDDADALEVTMIHSVATSAPIEELIRRRPFRAPHHTISYAGMVGGGPRLSPGEVTLAHHGTLLLDELPEFDRDVLEALRQPLEEGVVAISRVGRAGVFPARFQLVAAMNPCPCGMAGTEPPACRCPQPIVDRYLRRISGPLRDRIDLWVTMPRVPPGVLVGTSAGETSAEVAERIAAARKRQLARPGGALNARIDGRVLRAVSRLSPMAQRSLIDLAEVGALSARGTTRLLRVARTIGDLAGEPVVSRSHLEEAARFRSPSRAFSLSRAAG